MRNLLRAQDIRTSLGYAQATERRDASQNPAGIGIESIERMRFFRAFTGTANYSVTSTTLVYLDRANLEWEVVVSGKRPVTLALGVTMNAPAGGVFIFASLFWDGVDVSNVVNAMVLSDSATPSVIWSEAQVLKPTPGTHRIAVVARVNGGTGQVLADSQNRVVVRAMED